MSCSTRKRLLLIRATKDFSDGHVVGVKAACDLVGAHPVVHEYSDLTSLEKLLDGIADEDKFAFIYLAAHGSHKDFGEQTGDGTRWPDFAEILCRTKAMKPDGVLFIGCCGGGLKKVSLVLFAKCEQIICVCGPRRDVTPGEITLALHVFLHSFVNKCEDPQIGAERTGRALGIKFRHHDRHDMAADLILIRSVVADDPDFMTMAQIELRQATTTTPPPLTTPSIWDFDCCPDEVQGSVAQVECSDPIEMLGACRIDGQCYHNFDRNLCEAFGGEWFDDDSECDACPPDPVHFN